MCKGFGALVALLTVLGPGPALAQRPLVGTWVRFSQVNASGVDLMLQQAPAAVVVFSADGFFSQIAIPAGRTHVDKPLTEMTKEELIARFTNVEARRGTYTVVADTLTRVNVDAVTPSTIGGRQVQRMRIQGDTLFLTPADGTAGVVKFRRLRPTS